MGKRMVLLIAVLVMLMSSAVFANFSDNAIFQKINNIISGTQTWIFAISTGVAVVGVGFGVFKKQMAMGDPQRIHEGQNYISMTLWGWVIINGLPLLLNVIGQVLGTSA